MVKPYNYTDSELITQLIDGELSGDQKAYIIGKLNSDNALNRQFNLENAIHNAAQSKPKYEPSEKLTNDLFTKLGFSNGNSEKPLIPWISTLKKASAFLAAGLALTLIGYYAFTTTESTEKPKTRTLSEKKIPIVSSTSITDNTLQDDSKTDSKNISSTKTKSAVKDAKPAKKNNTSEKAVKNTEPTEFDYVSTKELESEYNSLIEKSESPINLESAPSMEDITESNLYANTSTLGNIFDKQAPFVVQLNPFKFNSRFFNRNNLENEIAVKVMNPYRTTDFMTNGGIAVTYYRKWKY